MRYYKNLYVSESIEDEKEEIVRRLNQKKILWNTYIIALAKGEQNHLEFFDAVLLQQEIIAARGLFIVGIAAGYDEALVLIEKITQEVYDSTGNADIRSYILKQENEL